MPVRDTDVGAFVAGTSPLSAATSNSGSGGKIGRARRTSNQDVTSVVTCLTLANVPVNSFREIDIVVDGTVRTTAPTEFEVLIQEDGTSILRRNFWSPGSSSAPTGGKDCSFSVRIDSRPSLGTHTYAVLIGLAGAATGTASLVADTLSPLLLNVYDAGAAVT